jgi:MFS superfamily sulfate permease-like transporter
MISTLSINPANRPTFQWDPVASGGVLTLRLFGALGLRELTRVAEAVRDRGRSPRDLVCIDFADVTHLDFRALSEFTLAISRLRDRGASIWFLGLSPYGRSLFAVAGQGPALRRLEWRAPGEADSSSLAIRHVDTRTPSAWVAGEEAWSATGI